jgi:sugar-specific transcriptional regulator TrmB
MNLFHKTFLNILENKDVLITDAEQEKYNLEIINENDVKSYDDVINMARHFIHGVKRQQYLIKTSNDYYIAKDQITNTIYICYKNVLTIDIDNQDLDIDIIKKKLSSFPETFRIYKSKRGYHIYCTSKLFDYRSKESVDFMLDNFCDPYYCIYSYIRGYCTRLNNKFDSEKEQLYEYIDKVGRADEVERILYLVNLMERYSKKYKDEINLNNLK